MSVSERLESVHADRLFLADAYLEAVRERIAPDHEYDSRVMFLLNQAMRIVRETRCSLDRASVEEK